MYKIHIFVYIFIFIYKKQDMIKNIFIEKANKIHNSLYSYILNNENICYKDKINIVCKKHGIFSLTVNNHLNGRGCPYCKIEENKNNFINKQLCNFINKAKQVHGDKYDYSKVNYVNAHTKVCIICPKHGEFWQTPDSHLRGSGCSKCSFISTANKKALTSKEFIEKAKQVHGDKYDYSKIEYVNTKTPVCIICPKHGEFWQTPNGHLSGNNCPLCKGKQMNQNVFLKRMKDKYGDLYDLTKANYVKSNIPVIIGYKNTFFEIEPRKILNSKKPILKKRITNINSFIEKAKQVHGDKYDYSKVNYIKSTSKVCIICPKHGEFWQRPNDHLNGYGCMLCKESKLERKLSLFLDKKNIKYIRQYYAPFLSEKYSHQSLDFYLPDYNIVIECQGRQHFEPIKYFGGNDKLKKQILLDTTKKEKCELNKINIIYLIDSHINLISIINNVNYNNIYSENNSFKSMNKLLKIILK